MSSDLGNALAALSIDQSEWSQETFGDDYSRGPVGALRHLAREAVEAVDSIEEHGLRFPLPPCDPVRFELADCFLLILDASRRAGMYPGDLIRAAADKMEINKARVWSTPRPGEPVEHVR